MKAGNHLAPRAPLAAVASFARFARFARFASVAPLAPLALLALLASAAAVPSAARGADGAGRPGWPLLLELRPDAAERRFSLDLGDLSVAEALRFCLSGTGLQLVEADTLDLPARGALDSVTVGEALDAILRTHDLTWRVEGKQVVVGAHEEATFSVGYLSEPDSPFWKELEEKLRPLLSERGRLVVHPRTGAVRVIDRPSAVARIGSFLEALERDLERQVNIEAKLVEVSLDDRTEIGVDWTVFAHGWDDHAGNTGSGGLLELGTSTGHGVFQMGVVRAGRFEALLDMLESRGNARVLSRPRLAAMGNEPAEFRVTENIPYYVLDVFTAQGSDPYVQYSLEFREAGVTLEVIARAAEDGAMTLKVHPRVSSLTGYTEALPNLPPQPIIDQRETRTTVRMRDGETLVIGGLLQELEDRTTHGIPLLSRLPLLGALFRRTETTARKQELVIFLTPTVLADSHAELRRERGRSLLLPRPFPAGPPAAGSSLRLGLAAHEHARGVAAYQAGDLRRALACAERAVALAPEHPELRLNHGLYLAAAGRAGEAGELWTGLLRHPATAGPARANLDALALWSGSAPADTASRSPAGEEPAVVAAAALNEASRLAGLGREAEARQVLERGCRLLPAGAEGLRQALEDASRGPVPGSAAAR